MNHRRAAAVAFLVPLLVVGCGRAAPPEAASPPAAEHRFVHVHEFPSSGGRPGPCWPGWWSTRGGGRGAWPGLRATRHPGGGCPVYVGVDAVSGRLLGALQTCEPPYRG
jgi:hypothetical protein